MSLRLRVVALIATVMFVSMLMGVLVAGYQVRQALSAELTAGLDGARQTVESAFEDLPKSDHPGRDLHQLVATFNGNRHVRATLLAADGRPVWTSRTEASGQPAPVWFQKLLGPVPTPAIVTPPSTAVRFRAIVLEPTAGIDASALWRELLGVILVLAASAAAGTGLVYFFLGAALQPLTALALQFGRIGTGDYSGRVAADGPSELLNLQRGFNRMASELAGTIERNRLLTSQLLTIQEEERADIARDLHDEIGPHLFAVNMDAELIGQLNEAGRHQAIPAQVRAIQDAVSYMQRQVRDLLGRLRPTKLTELGLNAAIADLARFWAIRRPDIAFELALIEDENRLPEAIKEVVYRTVQEAANNAVRHGNPKCVRIKIAFNGDVLIVSVADNGSGGSQTKGHGLGLVGMRERIAAAGGVLVFGPNVGSAGWTTMAQLDLKAVGSLHAEARADA
jgi:two-component system sensor histidine kinase UhpB